MMLLEALKVNDTVRGLKTTLFLWTNYVTIYVFLDKMWNSASLQRLNTKAKKSQDKHRKQSLLHACRFFVEL